MKNFFVIVNPNSQGGKTAKKWGIIKEQLERFIGKFDFEFTTKSGDATEITKRILKMGFDDIVVVGGDGTNNEVVNGYFENKTPINPEAIITFIPSGTGGDLRKTLKIPTDIYKSVQVFERGIVKKMDAGFLSITDFNGRPLEKYFVNITSFGIGGLVDSYVNRSKKLFGGKISFATASVKAFFRYKNKKVRLTVNGETKFEGRCLNVCICNGQYFGGGMWIAPMADPFDGIFDIVVLGNVSKKDFLFKLSRWIYRGTHIDRKNVFSFKGERIEACGEDDIFIDMDGETPGKLPLYAEVLKHSINVRVFRSDDDF